MAFSRRAFVVPAPRPSTGPLSTALHDYPHFPKTGQSSPASLFFPILSATAAYSKHLSIIAIVALCTSWRKPEATGVDPGKFRNAF
jgi:hypothetical protein